MIETLKVLEEIQRIDLEIKAIEEQEKEFAAAIDALGAEIRKENAAIEALASEAAAFAAQIKEAEEKIRESGERVSKDEKRLNSVKNDRELAALTKEINGANKSKKQGEQEKNNLAAKLSEKEGALNLKKESAGQKQADFDRLSAELIEKKSGWKETVEAKLKSKEGIKAKVRPDILKKYEMIRSRRGGLGLVLVKDEICQGCFTHIPPQVYIMLKKGTEEIQSCPHCHRLLYVETPRELEAI